MTLLIFFFLLAFLFFSFPLFLVFSKNFFSGKSWWSCLSHGNLDVSKCWRIQSGDETSFFWRQKKLRWGKSFDSDFLKNFHIHQKIVFWVASTIAILFNWDLRFRFNNNDNHQNEIKLTHWVELVFKIEMKKMSKIKEN